MCVWQQVDGPVRARRVGPRVDCCCSALAIRVHLIGWGGRDARPVPSGAWRPSSPRPSRYLRSVGCPRIATTQYLRRRIHAACVKADALVARCGPQALRLAPPSRASQIVEQTPTLTLGSREPVEVRAPAEFALSTVRARARSRSVEATRRIRIAAGHGTADGACRQSVEVRHCSARRASWWCLSRRGHSRARSSPTAGVGGTLEGPLRSNGEVGETVEAT